MKWATLSLAIRIESDAASHNADKDVDGNGKQVCLSGVISNLRLGRE